VLCLNCAHKLDAVPDVVEVEVVVVEDEVERTVKVNIADSLRALWSKMEERGYTAVIYCTAKKAVVAGSPPSPAKTIVECEGFTEI